MYLASKHRKKLDFFMTIINYFLCRNTIVGVTSFGEDCGDPQYPGVYARITEEVKTWIQAIATGTESSGCKQIIQPCTHACFIVMSIGAGSTTSATTPGPVGKICFYFTQP